MKKLHLLTGMEMKGHSLLDEGFQEKHELKDSADDT